MADTNIEAETPRRRRGSWQNRETRASSKYIAKRVSPEDHHALKQYADARGLKVAELLTPLIEDLIEEAHHFVEQGEDHSSTAQAS